MVRWLDGEMVGCLVGWQGYSDLKLFYLLLRPGQGMVVRWLAYAVFLQRTWLANASAIGLR